MTVARIVFGILYLAGAVANIILLTINSPASYAPFADEALVPFYKMAWERVAVPHLALFVPLLILYEIALGVLFVASRRLLKIALVGGILFCLGTVPFGYKMMSTNLPLGLIQVQMLWREIRRDRQEGEARTSLQPRAS